MLENRRWKNSTQECLLCVKKSFLMVLKLPEKEKQQKNFVSEVFIFFIMFVVANGRSKKRLLRKITNLSQFECIKEGKDCWIKQNSLLSWNKKKDWRQFVDCLFHARHLASLSHRVYLDYYYYTLFDLFIWCFMHQQ